MFLRNFPKTTRLLRYFTSNLDAQTAGEIKMIRILRNRFPEASEIEVKDISGGCGSMFAIFIEDKVFEGKKTIAQHRLVNEALKYEIKELHGLRIVTTVPNKVVS
ncbi:DgyrCDS3407 [Dimorphilus gyrociliatus]|uniref:DgyrCDS3407 n=1 Tax=Dimorphilus gyrociliatus TaxID=2664684 RepID=A0A7I8VI72_9ANNE|nr:DgyrCDS3407 [Dimorphilus gyrociliatus]